MRIYGNKPDKRNGFSENESIKLFFIIASAVFIPCLILWLVMVFEII
jgi:hypothetical protein